MLTEPHGGGRDNGMIMIGRADSDRVDAVGHFVEHIAPVLVAPGRGMGIADFRQGVVVDIADGNDVAKARGIFGLFLSFAADANAGEADFFVRAGTLGGRAPLTKYPAPARLTPASAEVFKNSRREVRKRVMLTGPPESINVCG